MRRRRTCSGGGPVRQQSWCGGGVENLSRCSGVAESRCDGSGIGRRTTAVEKVP